MKPIQLVINIEFDEDDEYVTADIQDIEGCYTVAEGFMDAVVGCLSNYEDILYPDSEDDEDLH